MFEKAIEQNIYRGQGDKSFIDKLLAQKPVDDIRALVKKPRLNREDLIELLHLLTSVEAKLLNFGSWDRYVILKYFVWIREFVAVSMQLYDYQDDLKIKEKEGILKLSDRTKQLFENNMRLMEHNVKFLVDLYFNIGRTTLSLGATGLLELLKNKYEVVYPQGQGLVTPQQAVMKQ